MTLTATVGNGSLATHMNVVPVSQCVKSATTAGVCSYSFTYYFSYTGS